MVVGGQKLIRLRLADFAHLIHLRRVALNPNPPTCPHDEPGRGLSNGLGWLAGPPEAPPGGLTGGGRPGIAAEPPSGWLDDFLG